MHDIIIIGAGPAGLLAAKRLLASKRDIKLLILEQGVDFSERDHNDEATVASGFGGAGLFTDGKLSLPPSASYLWSKLDKDIIKQSYFSVRSWLQGYEIDLPSFDPQWFNSYVQKLDGEKIYHSEKLDLEKSESIIESCERFLKGKIQLNTRVTSLSKIVINGQITYEIATDSGIFYANKVIIATGKIGASHLLSKMPLNQSYLVEVGLRIEVPNRYFIPYEKKQLDFKLIKHINDYEVRTFCCCKDGSVVKSKIDKYFTYNGMINEERTGKSNIGIVIRSNKGGAADKLLSILDDKKITFDKIDLTSYLNKNASIFGHEFDDIFIEVIKELISVDDMTVEDSVVYYPVVERLGICCDDFTPSSLKIRDENIWICGDATYKFRGLLAAFISGEVVAREILNGISSKIYIKESNVETTKIVFTAQSKEYYYCKDVICQYVLENNATPINPFQIFNYFLNDRVPRDLIRKGNNNLIMRCDELWVFGKISDGVLFEIKLAKDYKKPIKYFTIGTFTRDISEISIDQVKFDSEVHAKQTKKKDLIRFLKSDKLDEEDPLVKQLDMFRYID